ncbi:hypothetical protein P3T76_013436 [Phytophthora citrophthora]|uniref:Uncharacterized protein n=1 Tax=Phytophthora citrophthora TaxID=4793 RepID=A0AAD9G3Y4_9STRA|nr:hypothetical protein P3T76_013414 [Phytophthora citrophthora]KAK1931241.1 hypothetical protein P3T76_013430 [Phytophthora citrophthora]KAK1931247.1 hypothetical protein P3T76_013436 [Phytophthora citrophthora]
MSVISLEANEFQFLDELLNIPPTRAEVRSWPKELKNQRKLKLHCHRAIRYRHKKAAEMKNMREEYLRLERELEKRLMDLRLRGLRTGNGDYDQVQHKLQRLVLEREGLREENMVLCQKLRQQQKFLMTIQSARTQVIPQSSEDFGGGSISVTVRRIESQWQPVEDQSGCRVHFPHGRPSFFFHPFTQHEFDAIVQQHDVKSSSDSSQMTFTGQHLDWNVYHEVVSNLHGNPLNLGHIRCAKRMERSMDSILSCMKRDDGSSKWPIMPAASDIGVSASIDIQTLQHLDDEKYILVRDYFGVINFRYMCLVQQSETRQENGKRVFKFHYVAGDSKANRRTRDTEFTTEDKVSWITEEAGYSLTLVEASDTAVEVLFDSLWCHSKDQAHGHFVKFGHIVTRWEQLVTSSNLLNF